MTSKKILIVGAGGLLGSSLVKFLIEKGHTLVAVDQDVEKMMDRLKSVGVSIHSKDLQIASLDITNESDVQAFFSTCQDLDGAVNASYPRNRTYGAHFFDVSLASFNENLTLHLGSAFLFTQQCAKYFLRKKNNFSLVNISSIYGVVSPKFDIYHNTPMTMPVEYAAIKSALLHLNKYVVKYIHDSKFRINSVSPGGLFDNQPTPFLEKYKSYTHGAGMLDVNDMMGTINFLLSDDAMFVTGQNIIVDDGFSL